MRTCFIGPVRVRYSKYLLLLLLLLLLRESSDTHAAPREIRRGLALFDDLTLLLPGCHLKTTVQEWNLKSWKHFCFLFRITRERVGIKAQRTESRFVMGPGKYTVCRRVRAFFSPEMLQAWAVNGLKVRIIILYWILRGFDGKPVEIWFQQINRATTINTGIARSNHAVVFALYLLCLMSAWQNVGTYIMEVSKSISKHSDGPSYFQVKH